MPEYTKEFKCVACKGYATIKLGSKVWYNVDSWCTCKTPTLPPEAKASCTPQQSG